MLNYFFTIKSHIIDLFIVGGVMQYRFEIDVVPLLVGVVSLSNKTIKNKLKKKKRKINKNKK